MSAIFDNASSITQSNRLSVMSATTISGKRVSQRRGPFLYTFSVEMNLMTTSSEKYREIRKEISGMDYGVDNIATSIPTLTANNGTWGGTPVVQGSNNSGRFVDISGLTASTDGIILDGDYVQFGNNGKVYQVVGDFNSDSSGEVTIKLNSPLVATPVSGSTPVLGTSVVFRLAIDEAEFSMGFSPRSSTDNLVDFGKLEFTEVII